MGLFSKIKSGIKTLTPKPLRKPLSIAPGLGFLGRTKAKAQPQPAARQPGGSLLKMLRQKTLAPIAGQVQAVQAQQKIFAPAIGQQAMDVAPVSQVAGLADPAVAAAAEQERQRKKARMAAAAGAPRTILG